LPYKPVEELKERALGLHDEAANHRTLVKFHRRRLKECLSLAEQYEKELASLGIKLVIQKKSL